MEINQGQIKASNSSHITTLSKKELKTSHKGVFQNQNFGFTIHKE